jgi:hypothetical protein
MQHPLRETPQPSSSAHTETNSAIPSTSSSLTATHSVNVRDSTEAGLCQETFTEPLRKRARTDTLTLLPSSPSTGMVSNLTQQNTMKTTQSNTDASQLTITSTMDEFVNGQTHHVDGPSLTRHGFKREELVRLMLQSLRELGYNATARLLEQESGFLMEDPVSAQLRQCILAGDWDQAEKLLPTVDYDMRQAQIGYFHIRRQKYLECLERRQIKEALYILRQELRPLNYDSTQLHLLSSLLISEPQDIYRRAQWDGAKGNSRNALLEVLQQHISPSRMMPVSRLETLLRQAIKEQKSHCVHHTTPDQEISLLSDHCCPRNNIPNTKKFVLREHTDEVWFVAFSHSGDYLASASQDKTCIIWDVKVSVLCVCANDGCVFIGYDRLERKNMYLLDIPIVLVMYPGHMMISKY